MITYSSHAEQRTCGHLQMGGSLQAGTWNSAKSWSKRPFASCTRRLVLPSRRTRHHLSSACGNLSYAAEGHSGVTDSHGLVPAHTGRWTADAAPHCCLHSRSIAVRAHTVRACHSHAKPDHAPSIPLKLCEHEVGAAAWLHIDQAAAVTGLRSFRGGTPWATDALL